MIDRSLQAVQFGNLGHAHAITLIDGHRLAEIGKDRATINQQVQVEMLPPTTPTNSATMRRAFVSSAAEFSRPTPRGN